MNHRQGTARLAGCLYLVVVLSSPFVLMYVPGKLFVPGDPAATVDRIQADLELFRAYILAGLVSEVAFIATVLALHRLFREIDGDLAALMVVALLLVAPLALVAALARSLARAECRDLRSAERGGGLLGGRLPAGHDRCDAAAARRGGAGAVARRRWRARARPARRNRIP